LLYLVTHPSISFSSMRRPPPRPTLFPYTTLFRSNDLVTDLRALRYNAVSNRAQRSITISNQGAASPNQYTYTNYKGTAMTVRLRSEEHTSELQSRRDLVCRLLLEKKKKHA